MGKFEEAWKENRHVWESSKNLAKAMYLAGQQSRQAEVDQLKNLLEKDEHAHNLYYENANLQTLVEEKDKRIEEACESINSFFDNQVSTPTPREYANFIAEILETLRGEHE